MHDVPKFGNLRNKLLKHMSKFTIDIFELLILAEACLPPAPIARTMFFQDMSEKYYHAMTDNERNKAFEWMQKNPFFDIAQEDCLLFHDRYNPANQYKVGTLYEDKKEIIDCFKHKGHYHISKTTSILEDYIVRAVLCERKSSNA